MKVLSAEFVTSVADARGIPRDTLPQIAFVGRSNVGKSTLINALAGRTIAHTSAKPGKTRLANLYRMHVQGGDPGASGAPATWRLYFVDLPGYGYAHGGQNARAQFARVADAYFERGTVPLIAVLLIVDARHPGLDADLAAREWIATLGVPHIAVATKTDKLSRSAQRRAAREIEEDLNIPVLPVSAATGEGLDDLWMHIVKLASR